MPAAPSAGQPGSIRCSSAHNASVPAAPAASSKCSQRQAPAPESVTPTAGACFTPAAPGQARLKTSVPLVPPKPKLFFTATSIFISRAVLAQ